MNGSKSGLVPAIEVVFGFHGADDDFDGEWAEPIVERKCS